MATNNVVGTNRRDILNGTIGDDSISALAGNDVINGSLGNDTLNGGTGSDTANYRNLGQAVTLKARGFVDKGEAGVDQLLDIEQVVGAQGLINTIDASVPGGGPGSLNVDLSTRRLTLNGVPGLSPVTFEIVNFVNVIGTSNDDIISGNGRNNELTGGRGDDFLNGNAGDDVLIGVDPSRTSTLGLGEIDILTGGRGADWFVLGNEFGVFYDDGLRNTAGTDDFASIIDFNPLDDIVQLLGDPDDYTLEFSTNGTSLFFNDGSNSQELVAFFNGVTDIDLEAEFFNFVSRPELDLVVTGSLTGTLAFLENNGDTTFATPNFISVGAQTFPFDVTAADFNNDGKLDLANSNLLQQTVTVTLNNGDGTFTPTEEISVGLFPQAIVSEDFDADGNFDIATTSDNNNDVVILRGNGDGTFASELLSVNFLEPDRITTADFNNDGFIDLATSSDDFDSVQVALNNGDGSFEVLEAFDAGGLDPSDILAADLNGDGNSDLVTTNLFTQDISVFLNTGSGVFSDEVLNFTTGINPVGLAGGDFDRDGNFDLVTSNQGSNSVSVFLNDGNASFINTVNLATGGIGTNGIITADIDGDGTLDIATANQLSNDVSLFLGIGDGTFAPSEIIPGAAPPLGVGVQPINLVAGDF